MSKVKADFKLKSRIKVKHQSGHTLQRSLNQLWYYGRLRSDTPCDHVFIIVHAPIVHYVVATQSLNNTNTFLFKIHTSIQSLDQAALMYYIVVRQFPFVVLTCYTSNHVIQCNHVISDTLALPFPRRFRGSIGSKNDSTFSSTI